MNDKRKFAVLTGGSTGIGYELGIQFAKNGFDLLIAAQSERLDEACEALRALGAEVTPVRTDLATEGGVEALVTAVKQAGRPIDALALNAGVGASGAFTDETALADELNIIQVNIVAVVRLAKSLLPAMVARGEGRVLLTSSVAALAPGPFHAVYHASKAFVQSFGEAIREELKDSGVSVTCLLPGATESAFFARANMLTTKIGQSKKDDPAVVARQGFEAMMAGDDQVIAGSFKNKVQGALSKFLSDPVKARQSAPGNAQIDPADDSAENAVDMLTRQHREAEALFSRLEKADAGERPAIFETLATKLLEHMIAEEDVFYPAAAAVDQTEVIDARHEHAEAKALISQILTSAADEEALLALVKDLKGKIEHHVRDEEDRLFPACREQMAAGELVDLANDMRELLTQITQQGANWTRMPGGAGKTNSPSFTAR